MISNHKGYTLKFEKNPRGGLRMFAWRATKIAFTARGMTEDECIGLLNAHLAPKHKRHKFSKTP